LLCGDWDGSEIISTDRLKLLLPSNVYKAYLLGLARFGCMKQCIEWAEELGVMEVIRELGLLELRVAEEDGGRFINIYT